MKSYDSCHYESERIAFATLEKNIGPHKGMELYPNFELFDESKKVYLECDLVIIGQSFNAIVELKHWYGDIKILPDFWYHNKRTVSDPHHLNNRKCKILKTTLQKQLPSIKKLPYVQSIIVLTHPEADVEGDVRAKAVLKSTGLYGIATFNGIDELIKYIKSRIGQQDNLSISIGQFEKLRKYFDKIFDATKRKYIEQIPGYSIIKELEHTSKYISYLAKKRPSIGTRQYRLRVFGEESEFEETKEKQLRSLKILESLPHHPNIRYAHSHPNENNLIIEVSEWSDSITLDRKSIDVKKFGWRLSAKIVLQLAKALTHVHKFLLVHRNLQPKCIIINHNDEPEITDFELTYDPDAKISVYVEEGDDEKLTPYTAPEVFYGKPDLKSDVYSLGIIFYEMLIGKLPIKDFKDLEDTNGSIFTKNLTDFPSDLPPEIVMIIEKCICLDIQERFESHQVVANLQKYIAENNKKDFSAERQNGYTTTSLKIGDNFNTWKLLKHVAEGATSDVFLAENQGRTEILKIFKADYPKDRCLSENSMLDAINSPHVPRFKTFIQWNNCRWCIVQEAIEGDSMRKQIEKSIYPDIETFNQIASQLLDAIETLHDITSEKPRIIHNDINPNNILISANGKKSWLIDFGIASVEGSTNLCGTRGYIDPTLVSKGELQACPQSDLYSLGVTLFEWLTGKIPGQKIHASDLRANLCIEEKRKNLINWFLKVLRCSSTRYESAKEMHKGLKGLINEPLESQLEKIKKRKDFPEDDITLKKREKQEGVFTDEFVFYLNSTSNVTANNKHALAEVQSTSKFFGPIYEPFPLVDDIYKNLIAEDEKVVILTGHAGDGKTTIALDIIKKIDAIPVSEPLKKPLNTKEVRTYKDLDRKITIVKDMSEQLPENQQAFIEESIKPGSGSWLIISNTGPLINAFSNFVDPGENNSNKRSEVESDILGTLNTPIVDNQLTDKHSLKLKESKKLIFLANLSKIDNIEVATKFLKKIISYGVWGNCTNCSAINYCPIYNNVDALLNNFSDSEKRIQWIYRRLNTYERRMTMRQMAAHITFSLTGNQQCSEIRDRSTQLITEYDSEIQKGNFSFSNLFFGYSGSEFYDPANSLESVRIIKSHNFGSHSFPVIDRIMNENSDKGLISIPVNFKLYYTLLRKKSNEKYNISFRQSLRRLIFIFGNFPDESNQHFKVFINKFIQSQMLTSLHSWQKRRKIIATRKEQKTLVEKTLNVLLEEYSGFSANQYSNTDSKSLYLTLRRGDRRVFQPAQLVLAKYDFDEFGINFCQKTLLPFLYLNNHPDIQLLLSLPLLDYIYARGNGELVNGLDTIYLNQLARFHSQLLPLNKHKNTNDHIALLHVGVEGKVRLYKYEINSETKKLELY